MARAPRVHVDGAFRHVILRGNHREPIFFEPRDRDYLDELVARVMPQFGMRVHAYCWMTNHVHLLVELGSEPLQRAMLRIAGRFAREVQRRRDTTGHLFEKRYLAYPVEHEVYLLELIRYVHLNPVRAGLVDDPGSYRWSSHHAYLGTAYCSWLTTSFALRLFGPNDAVARAAYARFVFEGIGCPAPMPPDLPCDRDGHTATEPAVNAPRAIATATATATATGTDRLSLQAVIASVCAEEGFTLAQLCAGGRRRRPAHARARIVYSATTGGVASIADLSRIFGRSASTLCEGAERIRQQLEAPVDRCSVAPASSHGDATTERIGR